MRTLLPGVALCILPCTATAASPADVAPPIGASLIVIESPDRDAFASLLDRGVTVVWNGGDFLLSVGQPWVTRALRADGMLAHEIGRVAPELAYYCVSPVPAHRLPELRATCHVLWSAGGQAIVEVPGSRLPDVLARGFDVARISFAPARPPRGASAIRWRGPSEVVPAIETMVDAVSGLRIDAHVQRLQDFGTRYAPTDSAHAAAAYLFAELESYGIDSVGVHDWAPGLYAPNVVAVIPGVTNPDELVIVGAHYDSFAAGSPNDAPGADDNASGTSLVLEAARVLAAEEYARTLVFVAFGAEELGLLGSQAWVQEVAIAQDLNIVAMLNADMIGYSASPQLDMTLISQSLDPTLRDLMVEVGAEYVPELPLVDGQIPGGTSDHASFWQGGFPAIMFFEDGVEPSPFIHTNRDVVGQSYNAPLLAYRTVRLGVAFLATLAVPRRLAIAHEPLADTEDTSNPYRVAARLLSPVALDPDSLLVRFTVDGIEDEVPLLPGDALDEYEAYIPAQSGGRWVSYYLVAGNVDGERTTDPLDAPAGMHTFFVGSITTLFADDFESSSGWQVRLPGDTATSGLWTLDDPVGTGVGLPLQPEYDHTPGDASVLCYVTGNAPPGAPIGEADVDGGRTTLQSPLMDLTGHTNARLTYYRWFSNSAGPVSGSDEWVVTVSPDGGTSWVELERLAENRRGWIEVGHELSDYIPLTNEVRLRFAVSDEGGEDIVEAALDDVSIRAFQDPTTPVDPTSPVDAPPVARLTGVVPNPFGSARAIRLGIPAPERPVTLRIYDLSGRLVRTLLDGRVLSGTHDVRWDGTDTGGREIPSGTYFLRVRAGRETMTRKLVLIR